MNLRAFRRDTRGAAAVEFALTLPILVTLQLGSVELVRAFEAQRRIEAPWLFSGFQEGSS